MRLALAPSLAALAAVTLLVTGCSAGPTAPAKQPGANVQTEQSVQGNSQVPSTTAPGDTIELGPVDTYLAWLTASRKPDAPLACSLMTDELIDRVLTALNHAFASCEQMTIETAAMYSASGQSAEVEIEVVSESASSATLFSTYVSSGKCGTIVLERSGEGWLINEQSEECVAR